MKAGSPKSLEKIKQVLANSQLKIESAQLEWVPKTTVALPTQKSEAAYELLSALDDHEDVQNVYTNLA
jgi:transcriptional/translational regulatory protein YebC/TACO1